MNGISLSSVAKSDLDCPSSEDQDEADFPRTIIVTNVDVPIFENEGLKVWLIFKIQIKITFKIFFFFEVAFRTDVP